MNVDSVTGLIVWQHEEIEKEVRFKDTVGSLCYLAYSFTNSSNHPSNHPTIHPFIHLAQGSTIDAPFE